MDKVFGYPAFDSSGEKILTTYDNAYQAMMMDIRIYRMHEGESRQFCCSEEELAVLLLFGEICCTWGDRAETFRRRSVFTEGPTCVHVCKETAVSVSAKSESRILVQRTKNEKIFAAEFYVPSVVPWRKVCYGEFGNVAKRRVNTIFDHEISPDSNMVLGEVINERGNWSGYLPHRHPQPEVYYFEFDRPEGFGASFVGEEVFKSVDGSFSAIPGGRVHPQAVAPGFLMYTCWMIRHLDGKPWLQTDRNEDERYLWLHDAVFDEEKGKE